MEGMPFKEAWQKTLAVQPGMQKLSAGMGAGPEQTAFGAFGQAPLLATQYSSFTADSKHAPGPWGLASACIVGS